MKRPQGFTVIEMMVVAAIIAILAAVAAPSMASMVTHQRVTAAAEVIKQQVALARLEAERRNTAVRVVVNSSAGGWAIGITDQATCNPATAGSCTISTLQPDGSTVTAEYAFDSSDHPGVVLSGTAVGTPIVFNRHRGTTTVANLEVTLPGTGSLRIMTSGVGRISTCSPSGAISGYAPCEEGDA